MVGIVELWLPILLSAVLVFVASSVIHMALRYHWNDWDRLPGEDNIRAAFRKENVPPGDYCLLKADSMAAMSDPEFIKQCEEGPVGFVTVHPSGAPKMGAQLALWFLYSVLVGLMVAYVAGRTLEAGADYLAVFRIAGAVAFLTYAGGDPVQWIWFKRGGPAVLKSMLDGLIYALVTAGAFGWLWP